jgi:hypothetical protein
MYHQHNPENHDKKQGVFTFESAHFIEQHTDYFAVAEKNL